MYVRNMHVHVHGEKVGWKYIISKKKSGDGERQDGVLTQFNISNKFLVSFFAFLLLLEKKKRNRVCSQRTIHTVQLFQDFRHSLSIITFPFYIFSLIHSRF